MEQLVPPKLPDGSYDREATKAMFMASDHLDWTTFAEKQGWREPGRLRQEFPVKSWQLEKRDGFLRAAADKLFAKNTHMSIKWSNEVFVLLEKYSPAIDRAREMLEAVMNSIAFMYKDYTENFINKPERLYGKNGARRSHPFEKLDYKGIAAIAMATKGVTDAKVRSISVDKWFIDKLIRIQMDEPPSDSSAENVDTGHRMLLNGKDELTTDLLIGLWEKFHDKPQMVGESIKNPSAGNETSNEVEKIATGENGQSEP